MRKRTICTGLGIGPNKPKSKKEKKDEMSQKEILGFLKEVGRKRK